MPSFSRRFLIMSSSSLTPDSVASVKQVIYKSGQSKDNDASVGVFAELQDGPRASQAVPGKRFRLPQVSPGLVENNETYFTGTDLPTNYEALSDSHTYQAAAFVQIIDGSGGRVGDPGTDAVRVFDAEVVKGNVVLRLSGSSAAARSGNISVVKSGTVGNSRWTFSESRTVRCSSTEKTSTGGGEFLSSIEPGDAQVKQSPLIFGKAVDVIASSDEGQGGMPGVASHDKRYMNRPKLLPLKDGRLMLIYITTAELPAHHWYFAGYNPWVGRGAKYGSVVVPTYPLSSIVSDPGPTYSSNLDARLVVSFMDPDTETWTLPRELTIEDGLPTAGPMEGGGQLGSGPMNSFYSLMVADIAQDPVTDEIVLMFAVNALGEWGDIPYYTPWSGEVPSSSSGSHRVAVAEQWTYNDDAAYAIGGGFRSNCVDKIVYVATSVDGLAWNLRAQHNCYPPASPDADMLRNERNHNHTIPGVSSPLDYTPFIGGALEFMPSGRLLAVLCSARTVYHMHSDDRGETWVGGSLFDTGQFHVATEKAPDPENPGKFLDFVTPIHGNCYYLIDFVDTVRHADIAIMEDGSAVVVATHTFPTYGTKPIGDPEATLSARFNSGMNTPSEWYCPRYFARAGQAFEGYQVNPGMIKSWDATIASKNDRSMLFPWMDACIRHTSVWVTNDAETFMTDPAVGGVTGTADYVGAKGDLGEGSTVINNQGAERAISASEAGQPPGTENNPYSWLSVATRQRQGVGPTGWGLSGNRVNNPDPCASPEQISSRYPYHNNNKQVSAYDNYFYGCTRNSLIAERSGPECIEPAIVLRPDGFGQIYATTHNWATAMNYEQGFVDLYSVSDDENNSSWFNIIQYHRVPAGRNIWALFELLWDEPAPGDEFARWYWSVLQITGAMYNAQHKGVNIWNPCFNVICGRTLSTKMPGSTTGSQAEILPDDWSRDINSQASSTVPAFPYSSPDLVEKPDPGAPNSYDPAANYPRYAGDTVCFDFRRSHNVSASHIMVGGFKNCVETSPGAPSGLGGESYMNQSAQGRLFPVLDTVPRRSIMLNDSLQCGVTSGYVGVAAAQWKDQVVTVAAYCNQKLTYTQTPYIKGTPSDTGWHPSSFAPVPPLFEESKFSMERDGWPHSGDNDASALSVLRTSYWTPLVENLNQLNIETDVGTNISWRNHMRLYTFWPDIDGVDSGYQQVGYCSLRELPILEAPGDPGFNAAVSRTKQFMRSSGHEIALALVMGRIYNRVYDAVQLPDKLLWNRVRPRSEWACPQSQNNYTNDDNSGEGIIFSRASETPDAVPASMARRNQICQEGGALVLTSVAGVLGSDLHVDGGVCYRLVSKRFQPGVTRRGQAGKGSPAVINEDTVNYSTVFPHGRHSLPHPNGQDGAYTYTQTAESTRYPTKVAESNVFGTGLCGMFRAIVAPVYGGNIDFNYVAETPNMVRNAESLWVKLILEDTESPQVAASSTYDGARSGIQVLMKRVSAKKVQVALVDPFALWMDNYINNGTPFDGQRVVNVIGSQPVEIEVDDEDWLGWIEIVAGIQGRGAFAYGHNPPVSPGSHTPDPSMKGVQAFCFVRALRNPADKEGIGPFQTVCVEGVAPAILKADFPPDSNSSSQMDPDGRISECLEFGACGGLNYIPESTQQWPDVVIAQDAQLAVKTVQLHRSTTTPMLRGPNAIYTGGFETSIKGSVGSAMPSVFSQLTGLNDDGLGPAFSGSPSPMAFKYLWMTDSTDTSPVRFTSAHGVDLVRAGPINSAAQAGGPSIPAQIPTRSLSYKDTLAYPTGSPFFRNVSDYSLSSVDSGITNEPRPPTTSFMGSPLLNGMYATFSGEAETTGFYAFFTGYDAPASATTSLPVSREWSTSHGRLTDDAWRTPMRYANVDIQASTGLRVSKNVRKPTVYDCPPVAILFDAYGESGFGTTGDRVGDLVDRDAVREKFNPEGVAFFGKNWTGCTIYLTDSLDGLNTPYDWDSSDDVLRYSFGLPGDGLLTKGTNVSGWQLSEPDRYIDLWSWTPHEDPRTGYSPSVRPIAPYTRNFPKVGPYSFTFRQNVPEPSTVSGTVDQALRQNTSLGQAFPSESSRVVESAAVRAEIQRDIEKHTPWRPHQFKSKDGGPSYFLRLIINSARVIPSDPASSGGGNSISNATPYDPGKLGEHTAAYVYKIKDNDEDTLFLEANPEIQGFNAVDPTIIRGVAQQPLGGAGDFGTWLVSINAIGLWAGHDNELATYNQATFQWEFTAPSVGDQVAIWPNSESGLLAPQMYYGPSLEQESNDLAWRPYSFQIDSASVFSDRFACQLPANHALGGSVETEASMARRRSPGEGFRYLRLMVHGSMKTRKEDARHICGRFVAGPIVDLSGPDFQWGWSRSEASGTNLVTTKGGPRYSRVEHSPRRVFSVSHHPLPPASTPSRQVWGGGGSTDPDNPDGARGWGSASPAGWSMRPRTWSEVVDLARALDISNIGCALVFEGNRALSTYSYGMNAARNATQAESDPEVVMMARMTKMGSLTQETYVNKRVKVQINSTSSTSEFGASVAETHSREQCTPKPVMTIASIELEEEF